jgi:hypothetical protein
MVCAGPIGGLAAASGNVWLVGGTMRGMDEKQKRGLCNC